MRVERLTGVLGATVYVDDVKVLTDSQLDSLREIACEHEVIIIPNQSLMPLEQVDFSRRLGPAAESPFIEPSPDHPEVIKVLKEAKDGNAFNFGVRGIAISVFNQPHLRSRFCMQLIFHRTGETRCGLR